MKDNGMTLKKCATACAAWPMFGVEYGRECYCGTTLSNMSAVETPSDCYQPCYGNSSETCGAPLRLNIYETTTPIKTIAAPITYTSQGCYSEPDTTGSRALTGISFNDYSMTVEKCAVFCDGYTMFGLEYSRSCFCGNNMTSGAVATTGCNTACAGNSSESCGGSWKLNIYTYGSPTSMPVAPTPVASMGSYVPVGCWSDNAAHRVLTEASFTDSNMTAAKCHSVCNGYAYFGTEYSNQCYCGNEMNPSSAQTNSTDCYFQCAGDHSEACGASNRLNLYHIGAGSKSSTSSSSGAASSSASSSAASSTTVTISSSSGSSKNGTAGTSSSTNGYVTTSSAISLRDLALTAMSRTSAVFATTLALTFVSATF